MRGLNSAIRMMFRLPALWIALMVTAVIVAFNSEPFVDIALYAFERLF